MKAKTECSGIQPAVCSESIVADIILHLQGVWVEKHEGVMWRNGLGGSLCGLLNSRLGLDIRLVNHQYV